MDIIWDILNARIHHYGWLGMLIGLVGYIAFIVMTNDWGDPHD